MSARPLKVLLAVADRQNLRQCVRLLNAFGHQVCTAASPALAAERLRADPPDVLVAGGGNSQETALALLRAVPVEGGSRKLYKLLVTHDPTQAELLAALEAGADDFLSTPVDPAELLARIRAAARFLEWERRFAALSEQDEISGLLTRRAFLPRLQKELQSGDPSAREYACLVLQPDSGAELQALHGKLLLEQAFRELLQRLNPGESRGVWGRVGAERLACAFAATAEEARNHAEQLRAAVAEAGFHAASGQLPWTISLGFAVRKEAELSASQLLDRAEQALKLAQESGGNEVAAYDEVVEEERRWADLAGEKLFAGALLRNVMLPCPCLLHTTDSLPHADAVLRQTRLPALPVVNEEGKLTGLLSVDRERFDAAIEESEQTPVTTAMLPGPVSFDEATTMNVMIDFFSQEAPPVVVVVHKGRPTGLVTPDSLATLVEPLTTASFAPLHDFTGRAGLIVPQLCAAE